MPEKRKQIAKRDRPALIEAAFELLKDREPGEPLSAKETAQRLGVGLRTIIRWKQTILAARLVEAWEETFPLRRARWQQEYEIEKAERKRQAKLRREARSGTKAEIR